LIIIPRTSPKRRKLGSPHDPPGAFTPKHGSWLNLIEGFFSKLARSVLRHIPVASKQELKERLMAAIEDVNQHPVVHTWSYKLNKAA
jgi:transposase